MSVSEFCLELELDLDSSQSHDFSTIIFSNLYLSCSFIFSHPLYFSYFLFFSPYLFKLFSFLSPLFLTTSLLLLALITVSPGLLQHHHEFQHSEFEELQVYKIVFEGFTFEVREKDPDEDEEPIDKCVIEGGSESPSSNPETSSDEALWPEINLKEESRKENDGKGENLSWEREEIKEEELKPMSIESNEVAEQPRGSKAIHNKAREAKVSTDHDEFETPKALSSYPSFGSYGSMRKEKEWKRTLACKLFEERHNAEGGGGAEGMDMLWETNYEAESTKVQLKNPKKGSYEDYGDDDDEEDDEVGVQLCCLQALKFSAGKMSLGMGRPSNIVRFSKAVKGMRWLQHHVSKASKKGTHH